MKRASFLFAVILGACVIGITARAQFTTNPKVVATTNTTALAPIGNGFGVALLGYGLPEYNTNMFLVGSSNVLFFATPMGQPSASDSSVSSGVYQFYVVSTDKDGSGTSNQSDLVAFKVSTPVANPTTLTVVRTWVARAETNNAGVDQAASLGACGVTTSGTITLRADGTQSPHGNAAQQGMFVFNADSLSTVVITNVPDPSCLVTNNGDANTFLIGSMGRNKGLLTASSFANTQYVARADISFGPGDLPPHSETIAHNYSRGIDSINDTAQVLAFWFKTQAEVDISGSDVCTHLKVLNYTDSGGTFLVTSSNEFVFGNRVPIGGTDDLTTHIDTNAALFFGATPFNGPAQISINDSGEMAFPVGINSYLGNNSSNGTRCAEETGILWKDANSGTFRLVATSKNPIFLQIPGSTNSTASSTSTTNNLFSPPVVDNRGNVFFEAAYTNFVGGGVTNYYSAVDISNAVYQAVPNQYPNPTSWTTRILLREGDTFVEPTSGNTIEIFNLPLASGAGTSRGDVPRALGANSINRTPVPGTTNQLGGVIVCATLSNRTLQTRFDGVLYIAPIPSVVPCPPFLITSITRSGNNVTLVWNGQIGNNVVQYSTGAAGGSFNDTHTWVDLATVTMTSCAVANYTDVGGAANIPSRYYRIKLQ